MGTSVDPVRGVEDVGGDVRPLQAGAGPERRVAGSAQVDGVYVVVSVEGAGERFVHGAAEAGGMADEEGLAHPAEIVHGDHGLRSMPSTSAWNCFGVSR